MINLNLQEMNLWRICNWELVFNPPVFEKNSGVFKPDPVYL